MTKQTTQKEIDKEYNEFWKEIVENKDGTINKEQLKKELYDFHILIGNASKVYDALTKTISKPMTPPEYVIEEAREIMNEEISEALEEYKEDYEAEIKGLKAENANLRREIDELTEELKKVTAELNDLWVKYRKLKRRKK
jgi:predicted RNase H-like nuclease (RuvC/YqgF family)